MISVLTVLKLVLIVSTALFIAFHTVVFIRSIEPNPYLAWLLALAIEGFLIVLAITKTRAAKILLIPLFLVSVVGSSASLIVRSEADLNLFLNLRNMEITELNRQLAIRQLERDIAETQWQIRNLDQRYLTKTLERERRLKDQLNSLLSEAGQRSTVINYTTLYKLPIFFCIVCIVQAVSLYIAAGLKNSSLVIDHTDQISTDKPSVFTTDNGKETIGQIFTDKFTEAKIDGKETNKAIDQLTDVNSKAINNSKEAVEPTVDKKTVKQTSDDLREAVKKLRDGGMSLSAIALQSGVSKPTLIKLLHGEPLRDDILSKLQEYVSKKVGEFSPLSEDDYKAVSSKISGLWRE